MLNMPLFYFWYFPFVSVIINIKILELCKLFPNIVRKLAKSASLSFLYYSSFYYLFIGAPLMSRLHGLPFFMSSLYVLCNKLRTQNVEAWTSLLAFQHENIVNTVSNRKNNRRSQVSDRGGFRLHLHP